MQPFRLRAMIASARSVGGRMSWGLVDQAISSLTNFAVGIVVAHNFELEEFGAFTLAWFTYGLVLNISRGLATDPLVVRFSGVPAPLAHRGLPHLRHRHRGRPRHGCGLPPRRARHARAGRRRPRRARHRAPPPVAAGQLAVRVLRRRRRATRPASTTSCGASPSSRRWRWRCSARASSAWSSRGGSRVVWQRCSASGRRGSCRLQAESGSGSASSGTWASGTWSRTSPRAVAPSCACTRSAPSPAWPTSQPCAVRSSSSALCSPCSWASARSPSGSGAVVAAFTPPPPPVLPRARLGGVLGRAPLGAWAPGSPSDGSRRPRARAGLGARLRPRPPAVPQRDRRHLHHRSHDRPARAGGRAPQPPVAAPREHHVRPRHGHRGDRGGRAGGHLGRALAALLAGVFWWTQLRRLERARGTEPTPGVEVAGRPGARSGAGLRRRPQEGAGEGGGGVDGPGDAAGRASGSEDAAGILSERPRAAASLPLAPDVHGTSPPRARSTAPSPRGCPGCPGSRRRTSRDRCRRSGTTGCSGRT